ncbi:MAG TPA: hypothetical protein VLJ42_02440 [Solirubrobacteraceae bacterium]|nr:hypothetical protein [Solirubrobacteraceae bacterium]
MTLNIPFNRLIAFVKPWINIGSGFLAAWLAGRVNLAGIPGVGADKTQLASQITAGVVGLLTAGAAQVADLKWLQGHHIQLQLDAAVAARTDDMRTHIEDVSDHPVEDVPVGELPSDDEEFMTQPPFLPAATNHELATP